LKENKRIIKFGDPDFLARVLRVADPALRSFGTYLSGSRGIKKGVKCFLD